MFFAATSRHTHRTIKRTNDRRRLARSCDTGAQIQTYTRALRSCTTRSEYVRAWVNFRWPVTDSFHGSGQIRFSTRCIIRTSSVAARSNRYSRHGGVLDRAQSCVQEYVTTTVSSVHPPSPGDVSPFRSLLPLRMVCGALATTLICVHRRSQRYGVA